MKFSGFTILEVTLAVFLVAVGALGSYALIQRTLYAAKFSQDKLIASYLAQEGIEVVKNVRDTNWLKGQSWDMDLSEGEFNIDYKTRDVDNSGCPAVGETLKIGTAGDDNGFYNCSSGNETKFTRKVIISDKVDLDGDTLWDKMTVTVEVKRIGFMPLIVTAQDVLYKWK